MAKKGTLNKSQAIRDALKEHPRKPPREIAEILKAKGVNVEAQYVSVIKSQTKNKRRITVKVRKPQRSGSMSALGAALDFIRAAGGLEAAKSALKAVEEIRKLS